MTTLRKFYLRNSFFKHGVCAMLLSVCITGPAAAQSLYGSESDASEISAAERRAYLMEQRRAQESVQETQAQSPAQGPQYQATPQRAQPQPAQSQPQQLQRQAQASYDPYAQYRAQQQQPQQPQQYQRYPAPQQQPQPQQQNDADIYDPYSLSRQTYQPPQRQPQQQQAAPKQQQPQQAAPKRQPQQQAQAPSRPAPAVSSVPAQAGEYRLGASDALRITVFGHKDLSGDFAIDGSGYIAMPLIQRVYAMGLTTRQLEDTIQSSLSPDYLKNPRVAVEVLNYRPFFILGEVANKGRYEYAEGMTVINAVAQAGGFTYRANKDKITIKRYSSGKEEKVTETTVVMPGDVITVPERFF